MGVHANLYLFLDTSSFENSYISFAGPRALVKECETKIYFFYFAIKTYVVGTQKNRLNEAVLLSTQNICYN